MTEPKKKWTLTYGKSVFSEADLTAGDIALAQIVTGDGWYSADPLRGPNHTANLLAILVARTEGRELHAVQREVAEMTAAALVDSLDVVDA